MVIRNYSIDANNFSVLCENKPVGCVETAAIVAQQSKTTFKFYDWLKFYILDFLATHFQSFKQRQFSIVSGLTKEILCVQKKFLKTAEKVNRFISNHFDIYSKNVNDVCEAEVICLGEIHGTLSHMLRNGQLIDALATKDDLLLVERDDNIGGQSDQDKFVQSPIQIKGWDKRDPDLEYELTSSLGARATNAIGRLLFGDESRNGAEDTRELFQKVIDNLPDRNQHMCKVIANHLKPGRRIFVIAGKGHFLLPDENKKEDLNLEGQRIAVEETLDYLQTKKYAILVPHTQKPRFDPFKGKSRSF